MSIYDAKDWWWWWWLCLNVHVFVFVCDFLYVAIIQAYYVSSYIDFSRAMLECFKSGNLNQNAFWYSYIQRSSQLRKSPHSCVPERFQEFLDASDGTAIPSFKEELDKLKVGGGVLLEQPCANGVKYFFFLIRAVEQAYDALKLPSSLNE